MKLIFFASLFSFSSACFAQGDINLSLSTTNINQAIQALVSSKSINFGNDNLNQN
jgi:hypothetical protein